MPAQWKMKASTDYEITFFVVEFSIYLLHRRKPAAPPTSKPSNENHMLVPCRHEANMQA